MQWDEFSDWDSKISQWAADYHTNLRDRPVRAQSAPGEVAALIAPAPPEGPQDMGEIMEYFERVVMPGITHWQHPRFFAYFLANAAPPFYACRDAGLNNCSAMHALADLTSSDRNGNCYAGLASASNRFTEAFFRRNSRLCFIGYFGRGSNNAGTCFELGGQ